MQPNSPGLPGIGLARVGIKTEPRGPSMPTKQSGYRKTRKERHSEGGDSFLPPMGLQVRPRPSFSLALPLLGHLTMPVIHKYVLVNISTSKNYISEKY